MPRPIPTDRFDAAIRAATRVFLRQGYRRTQMADIADELGVAKGTLYLYFESKEALFEQALLHADRSAAIPLPRELPVPTPRAGATLRKVRARLAREVQLPALAAALAKKRARDTRVEIDTIVRELFRLLAAHRIGIKLLDRCSPDFPELAALYSTGGRGGIMALLERYIRARVAAKQLAPIADPTISARITLEIAAQWAIHRHWDPIPDPRFADEALIEDGVALFVSRALHGDLP
ncbi:MAG: TetR/AcrR family transcriptional regulator [Deltaproteobacteria bacterium]|nr:TetR/AcrR family transcriptional regulator [Deltaproteobacteria bacterium]